MINPWDKEFPEHGNAEPTWYEVWKKRDRLVLEGEYAGFKYAVCKGDMLPGFGGYVLVSKDHAGYKDWAEVNCGGEWIDITFCQDGWMGFIGSGSAQEVEEQTKALCLTCSKG